MSVCIRVMLSLCVPPPFAPRPSFKVWRRIKLLLHYTTTILTSMASDRVVSINSRTAVRSISMAVFPNVARPDGWTSWADFQLRVPLSSVLVGLCEIARLHTAAPVEVSWPHVWRVCRGNRRIEPIHQNTEMNEKQAKPWISVQFKLQHCFSVTLIYRYRNNSYTEITKAMTWPLGDLLFVLLHNLSPNR